MSVTEQDRQRAAELYVEAADGLQVEALARIAQALADERERARAPFLALAEELDDDSPYEGDNGGWADGSRAAERAIADLIRREAQESQ